MEEIQQAVNKAIKALFDDDVEVEITRPLPEHGDFATNAALKLAKPLNTSPHEIAVKLVEHLKQANYEWLKDATVANPGFINIVLSDQPLIELIVEIAAKQDNWGKSDLYAGQNIIAEYLDPNPLKELHIGHAYSGTIGDAIASLLANAGGQVHRVTYQGDVGLHVAKALFVIMQRIDNDVERLWRIPAEERPHFLGETYAAGAKAYETDEAAKEAIIDINKHVYDQSDGVINAIYDICKKWSLEYFDQFYKIFDYSSFEKNYMESAVAKTGKDLVQAHIADGIFVESQGAVIFPGENYGLHTRVFITSQGLPTYEAKDLGNAVLKWDDYNYDRSIIITADEQSDYFKVMLKALEQFAPEQVERTTHIAHGQVKLPTGKMSSRTGQVVRAMDLLETTENTAKTLAAEKEAPVHDTALGAIKYAFLKSRIGGDIVYDINESLSLEGNSGPYLQYAHARARSILAKSQAQAATLTDLTPDERVMAAKFGEFSDVIAEATRQLEPHLICTYLYDLAQHFNRFYEHNRIIGDPREAVRLSLVTAYATVLKNGLTVLRIPAPEHM